MIVLKWIWFLTGVGAAIQFAYWAALEVGYGLSLSEAPTVSHDWLFLTFSGAALYLVERLINEFGTLTSGERTP